MPRVHRRCPVSATPAIFDKAARLILDDRVRARGVAAIFDVQGDHDTYRVAIGDDWHSCTCPAVGACSHILAAGLRHEQIGDERAANHLRLVERSAA